MKIVGKETGVKYEIMSKQLTEGIIFLLDPIGGIIDGKPYRSKGKRNDIIEIWRELYSAAFNKCYLQIAPVVTNISLGTKRVFEYNGEIMPLIGWANRYGLKYSTLKNRVKSWGFERALLTSAGASGVPGKRLAFDGLNLSVTMWASKLKVNPRTIWARLRRGWPAEKALSLPIRENKPK